MTNILSWGWSPKFFPTYDPIYPAGSEKYALLLSKNKILFHFVGQCSFPIFCQEKYVILEVLWRNHGSMTSELVLFQTVTNVEYKKEIITRWKLFHNKKIQNIQQRCWFFYKIRNTFNHSNSRCDTRLEQRCNTTTRAVPKVFYLAI